MSQRPTTGHTAAFRKGSVRAETDGRLFSKVYEKNVQPVIDGLTPVLVNRQGHALEIGSGTGQHVLAFAHHWPDLTWTPSEPDPIHRSSINAWRAFENAATKPAIAIDAANDWSADPAIAAITPLQLILSLNVIHIAPFCVTEGIIKGAGKTLASGGFLAFYGPFTENGAHTGDGNAAFDARLRQDDPQWGVRDTSELTDLAEKAGLTPAALLVMPANNRLLIFKKP